MHIVKDFTVEDAAVERLTGCSKFSVISGADECFGLPETDSVVFITDLPTGILDYHAKFFSLNKSSVKSWTVILLNKNKVTQKQAKLCFSAPGVRVNLLTDTDTPGDIQSIRESIAEADRVQSKTVLIYSVRPDVEKELLKELLEARLPNYNFQTATETPGEDLLSKTSAAHVIVTGRTMEDFNVPLPSGISPLYVMTGIQENVQACLKRDMLAENLFRYVPDKLSLTSESAKKLFFCTSALYELWNATATDPRLDSRFVMWDEFGLPLPRKEYTTENCLRFLSRFNELPKLIRALTE